MGGKNKSANRTKNNARPSNSSRSAELLGSTIPQLGFSGIKDASIGFSSFSFGTEEIDSSLDSNFQLVFKKISKKDSTTKLKGLQEFADLIKITDPEDVKAVLPVWPRFYNTLATDTDNRVREASHNVHNQIVLKAKKNLAPYLKQIMAAWFTSQYDTYAPAASSATKAFKDAFPPNKFQEAIVFCQQEILTYINENLINQSPQTLTGKHCTPEEAEAKYERLLISCLQGYFLYFEKVPVDKIRDSTVNESIISNNKFWKLSKYKISNIRAAWFKLVSVICQKAIFLLENKEAQLLTTIIGNLDENEPTVLPYVWECTLLAISSIEEWWKYVNIEKLFLPKLWKVLKQGGQGNASVIYPNLLPMISHLPPSVTSENPQFYSQFFDNLRYGLTQKSVISSKSEASAVTSALVECVRYVVLKNQSDSHLCKTLITNYLLNTLEMYLIGDQPGHKTFFNQVAPLIQYWSKCDNSQEIPMYLQFFFDNLVELYSISLFNLRQHNKYDVGGVCAKQIEFLQSLKHRHRAKKNIKVQFTSEDAVPDKEFHSSIVEGDEKYLEELNQVVYKICECYIKFLEEKGSKEVVASLYSLVSDFDSKNFFEHVKFSLKREGKSEKLMDIFEQLLYKWLKNDHLMCKNLVDLTFLLFTYLEDSEKSLVLERILELNNNSCLEWSISEALSHPYNKDHVIQKWLRHPKIDNFFINILEKEIQDDCSPELRVLLKLAFTENENGDLFISAAAIKDITQKLSDVLLSQDQYSLTIDSCLSLAAHISSVIYTENLKLSYEDCLFLSLFKFTCNNDVESETITSDTLWEVSTSWQDATTILSKCLPLEEFKNLSSKCANIVEQTFLSNVRNQNMRKHLSQVIVYYLRASYKSLPLFLTKLVEVFFSQSINRRRNGIDKLCRIAEYVRGNLCSPYEEIIMDDDCKINDLLIMEFFLWVNLELEVLSAPLEDGEDEDSIENEDFEVTVEDKPQICTVLDDLHDVISEYLFNFALAESYVSHYTNVSFYHDNKPFQEKLKSLIKSTTSQDKKRIKDSLKQKTLNHGWLWSKAAYNFHTIFSKSSVRLCDIYDEFTENIEKDNLGAIHLTQLFSKHINFDHVQNKFENNKITVLRSLIHCEDIDVQIAEVFGKVEMFRSENVPLFLYDNPGTIDWEKQEDIIETVRLCSALMSQKFNFLTRRHWDFAVLSLVSWASNCLKSRHLYTKVQFQAMVTAVVAFFIEICKKMKTLQDQNITCNYIGEWNDVLLEPVHDDIAQLWLYFAEKFSTEKLEYTLTYLPFLQEFSDVTDFINHNFLFKFNENMPKWSKYLKHGSSLLTNSQPVLQLWGYKMLLVLIPGLLKIDEEAVTTNTPHRKGLIFEQFKDKLVDIQEVVNSMLMEFKLGEDSCRVEPSTDSFTYTLGYLLLWDVLLTLLEKSSAELRYQYADWLRGEDFLKNLLNNLFRLLPMDVLHYSEGRSKVVNEYFLKSPTKTYSEAITSESIEQFACWLYSFSLAQLPALVRQWWTGLESKNAQVVDKITSLYVSPHLITQEMNNVLQHQNQFKNMTVKVMPTVREILAVYTVDEAQMELVITLPLNYPLGSCEVQCDKQIGGTTHKQWLLQFKKCVFHQNSSVWDGLSLWNNNLDKKFDGVEECYICFAILHTGTYQLPKLSCQTCKKKFHSACLYKWFSTSNKSTCPICRNLF